VGELSAFNAAGQLVEFNVEMAHMLARELGVAGAFVPTPRGARMAEQMQTGYCDISVASAIIRQLRL
jgi:hypothetical protein